MSWNEIKDLIEFVVPILSLFFLILYVIKTWEMASATRKAAEATEKSVLELKKTRDIETAPYVIMYIQKELESSFFYLVVKNTGKGLAKSVKFQFTPELEDTSENYKVRDMNFIKNGVDSMPPNFEIRTFFDSTHEYMGKNLPLKYEVKITYYGGIEDDERIVEQTLDLSSQLGLSYIKHKDISDLAANLKEIVRNTDSISDSLESISNNLGEGLLISNPSFSNTEIVANSINLTQQIIAKLSEFEFFWNHTYKEKRLSGRGFKSIKSHARIISDQLILILSNKQKGKSGELQELVLPVANRLMELYNFRFNADGGLSIEKFNKLGDVIIEMIILTKNKLN